MESFVLFSFLEACEHGNEVAAQEHVIRLRLVFYSNL